MMHFIYVTDPMCSWCYGFGPQLSGLMEALPDARMDMMVGGLRAFNTEVMDAKLKSFLLGHWEHVAQASGLPFNPVTLAREGFVYDTEPACRALVAARQLFPDLPTRAKVALCRALQHAFYAEAMDITQGEVVARVAATALSEAGFPIGEQQFFAGWQSEAAQAETIKDFEQCKRWGVTGFPTLLVVKDGQLHMLASGFTKTAALLDNLRQLGD